MIYLFLAEKMVVCFVLFVCFVCFVATFSDFGLLFYEPIFKGKFLQTGEGGNLNFDHHFAFLTNFLKR